jgi:ankyrin repeat protein
LHGAYESHVAEELLKAGADVNARNKKGETPIFTVLNPEEVSLFVRHGADLSVRDSAGWTVEEVVRKKGPDMQEALRKAISENNN